MVEHKFVLLAELVDDVDALVSLLVFLAEIIKAQVFEIWGALD